MDVFFPVLVFPEGQEYGSHNCCIVSLTILTHLRDMGVSTKSKIANELFDIA